MSTQTKLADLATPLRVEFDFNEQRTSIVDAEGNEPSFDDLVEALNAAQDLLNVLKGWHCTATFIAKTNPEMRAPHYRWEAALKRAGAL